jgi:hypothetical protein
METFMFQSHDKSTSDVTSENKFPRIEVIVKLMEFCSHSVSESNDGLEVGPVFVFLRNFRVILRCKIVKQTSS